MQRSNSKTTAGNSPMKDEVAAMPYQDLLSRKEEIQERLQEITVEPIKAKKPSTSNSGTGGSKKRGSTGSSPVVANGSYQVPLLEKTTDVHWDYVMKEMMWLATDFQAERKRQISMAKKIAGGVKQYHKTRESRRLRELAEAELKRRRLAGRIGREVRGWWTKIERLIAYKQKLSADEERRQAMNKQLVTLVKQTERYTESLIKLPEEDLEVESSSDEESDGGGDSSHNNKHNRRRKRRRSGLTIEEALALGERTSTRRSKAKVIDYNRLHLDKSDDQFYGESTASDSGSDATFSPEEDDHWTDDETTLLEAEAWEAKERRLERRMERRSSSLSEDEDDNVSVASFQPDPRELTVLKEELSMPIESVMERYRQEMESTTLAELAGSFDPRSLVESDGGDDDVDDVLDEDSDGVDENEVQQDDNFDDSPRNRRHRDRTAHKKVTFAPPPKKNGASSSQPKSANSTSDAGVKYDADDDADASDVEDFVDLMDKSNEGDDADDSDEFKADQDEIDDETTMEQEERLPQEMTAQEELNLLKAENEMSVENLRKLYAGVLQDSDYEEDESNTGDDEGETTAKGERTKQSTGHISTNGEQENPVHETSAEAMELDQALNNGDGEDEDDDGKGGEEFVPSAVAEIDDETTIEAEEKLGREMSPEDELKMLQSENEIPVEQLRAMYASALNDDDEESPVSPSESDDDTRRKTRHKKISVGSSVSIALLDSGEEDAEGDGGEEFEPEASEEMDDETTMEAEEKLGRDMSYEDEIALLNKENEMSVEELRAKYAAALDPDSQKPDKNDSGDRSDYKAKNPLDQLTSSALADAGDDGEFVVENDEVDDETTLEAEERLGREMSPEEELAMLQRENETPIETLYAMYRKMEETQVNGVASMEDDDEGGEESGEEFGADHSGGGTKRAAGDFDQTSEHDHKRAKTDRDSDEGLAAIQALEASSERARRTIASRPFLLAPWVKLREYQQVGLNWLVSLQTHRLNGILADEMGLGKTLQTIALLAYLAAYKGIWGPHLVIVPTSVIVNWETELKRFCPGMKALCYYGSAKRRKELRQGWTKTNWYHVVVTSYQLAVQDAFAFKRKRWYYLILDEAQNIKNFQSQRWQTLINFNTQRRLLLTGTPLQNNLMELWSLLHFLMPYIFRSRKEFSFWFSNPMNNMIEGTANQNDEMISRLHGIIRPFVLRRLKKDVETQLPGKYEHVVKCPLSRRQMFFYEEFMARSSTRQALKKGGNYMGMMNVLMQLRKVCNHPDLFEPRSVVTPFVLNNVKISVPVCVVQATKTPDVFGQLSPHFLSPLWCGSGATPSVAASIEHDQVRSSALNELEDRMATSTTSAIKREDRDGSDTNLPQALSQLLREIEESNASEKISTVTFQREVNSRRCQSSPFAFPSRLIEAVGVQGHEIYRRDIDLLSSPSQLLAMRRSQQERADDMDEVIKKFVFCVPKAGARPPVLDARKTEDETSCLDEMLLEPLEDYLRPFRKAHARLTSFFPDKKLVQFDAGKLQTLAELLHRLKRGGHRVLIFTQMSKMLDILEAFLNLNGHTYVRLDGSTGVDRRQRLMDRFNNDPKIFSFILSTRSGGMGINLTGADTVIFYDSDWNPAMDAQAQDRAHRIGQTRDVHIYRLITEHSIEENILVKAQQKKNLDRLVMDKGKFDGTSQAIKNGSDKPETQQQEDLSDVFTKGGLRAILGVDEDTESRVAEPEIKEEEKEPGENITREQMEAAMTTLEDQDDVLALRGAQKEAAEELQEFDESIELKKDSDNEDDGSNEKEEKPKTKAKNAPKTDEPTPEVEQKTEEEELEKEFAAWQDDVGLDTSALEASLAPTEKYGLNFRQEIDPFWSVFAIMEEKRRLEAAAEAQDDIDIDQIEHEKAMEERRAIDDGDLLATRPRPEELIRQRNLYLREKARLRANKKRRTLTGENWELREDALTKKPFYYNADTGEALWDKPNVLLELEAEELAREKLWPALPLKPLVQIMSYLSPFPDRISCSQVCRQWRLAANDISFVRHVYPVEMGAIVRDDKHLLHNHYRTIADALAVASPGDTLELGDGHYWVSEPGLLIDFPLRLIGDEHNAANVVIEMSGAISWYGKGGWIEGITFRRPKISSGEGSADDMLRVLKGGRVDVVHSVIDNTGNSGASAVSLEGSGSKGHWLDVTVSGGGDQGVNVDAGARLELSKCKITGNRGDGISCSNKAEVQIRDSTISGNGGFGVRISDEGNIRLVKCTFEYNGKGVLEKSGKSTVSCSHNIAPASALTKHNIPGFRPPSEDQPEEKKD